MLHISICDDEPLFVEKIKQIIDKELSRDNITAEIQTFSNGDEFLKQYRRWTNELIFMDIDMPVVTGIDVINELEKYGKNKDVVLITSHDHLVLESLSYCPFQIIRKQKMSEDIPRALKFYFLNRMNQKDVLEFTGKGFVKYIETEKITYIEKYKNNIIVHLVDDDSITVRDNIQNYEQKLPDLFFVRVHIGYIVNLQHCSSIIKNDIILRTGVKIPISREKLKPVKEQFIKSRRY